MDFETVIKNRTAIRKFKGDIIFIIRDRIGSIGRKYIGKFMISSDKILCMYEVKFDEYDKEYQYGMDYDGLIEFKYLSDDLCKALVKSISIISGRSQNIEKSIKMGERGQGI